MFPERLINNLPYFEFFELTLFYNEEAAGIKNIMETDADTEEERIAVGNWLVGFSAVKGRLSEQEENCAQKEVDDVAFV